MKNNGFMECTDCQVWAAIPKEFSEKKHFGKCPKCGQPMYLIHRGKPEDIGLRDSQKVEAGLMHHNEKM